MQIHEYAHCPNPTDSIPWRDPRSEGTYLQYDLAACHQPVRQQKSDALWNPFNSPLAIIRHPRHDSCQFPSGNNFHFDEPPIVTV